MFGRYRGRSYIPVGGDEPFKHVKEHFQNSDVSIVNLETPITDSPASGTSLTAQRELLFRAPSSVVTALQESGVTIFSRANNHAEDRYAIGLEDTTRLLDEADLLHLGVSTEDDPFTPLHLNVHDVELILLAFTMRRNLGKPRAGESIPVAFSFDPDALRDLPPKIRDIRSNHPTALLLVSAHWGEEYRLEPTKLMQDLAHALIDAGADAILGHHPHVLQPVELYEGSPIIYSMGNLIFDQSPLARRQTALFEIDLGYRDQWAADAITIHPFLIPDKDQGPRPATIGEANQYLPDLLLRTKKYNLTFQRTEQGATWSSQ